jgi:hypothetical protein
MSESKEEGDSKVENGQHCLTGESTSKNAERLLGLEIRQQLVT